jgi:hypothetical protein
MGGLRGCRYGWVYGMGGWVGLFMGAEIVSSIVMYNLGTGPRGDPLFTAF